VVIIFYWDMNISQRFQSLRRSKYLS
jgi:hypothetical protein